MNGILRITKGRVRRWMGAALLTVLVGCGGSVSQLTGGSVPIGTSRLHGVVVRADNTSWPVAQARMTLHINGYNARIAADAQGEFDVSSIAGGRYLCEIEPASAGNLRPDWRLEFELPEDTSCQLIAAMPSYADDPAAADHLTLSPTQVTLHPGEAIRFIVAVLDSQNKPLTFSPSWLLRGDIGNLSADGLFLAGKTGEGTLTAYVGGKFVTARITVEP